MNRSATINGIRYEYVNKIKDINSSNTVVLCRDEHGCFCYCDADTWIASVQGESESSQVEQKSEGNGTSDERAITFNKYASPKDKIALFRYLFVGREDVYSKRYYSKNTGKSGYVPACGNEWVQGVCDKKQYKCAECPNRSFLPLTDDVLYRHLSGKDEFGCDVVGTYSMLPDETTKFLAIDFDEDSWKEDATAVRTVCSQYSIPVFVERSRSGNGAHIWLFFTQPVKAAQARRLGSGILTKAMEEHPGLKFTSYDRMFPNQDNMPKGGFGNLIALPLQGKARKAGNSVFVDERFIPYPDQWEYMYQMERITPDMLDRLTSLLCSNGEMGELLSEATGKPWERVTQVPLSPLDFYSAVSIIRANRLYVRKDGLSSRALNRIKRLAAFKNPVFFRTQSLRMPVYQIPRIIDTSEETEQYIAIPRGCEESMIDLLESANAEYSIGDERNSGRSIAVRFNGTLRPEQQKAADAMLAHDTGILSATTAFGKTVVASYLISERKANTLILVHSSALLQQWKKALSQFLIFDDPLPEQPKTRGRRKELSHIGQLGSGKDTINNIVDIAIMQSVVSGDEVRELVKNYGMVIVDECHHVSAFTFEKILREVNAKYVYGLTATPKRQDGHQPIIFMQCGLIRYRVDAKEQALKCSIEHYVTPVFTDFRIAESGLTYAELCAKLCADETRNDRIANDVIAAYSSGRNPIALTERKEHADLLGSLIAPRCNNLFVLSGKDSAKEKREKLEAIKAVPNHENMIILATGKYVGEGFDEPRLDTLFLAMPISWEGTLAQYAGRLHRSYEGKTEVRIYDYADIFVPALERSYLKRVKGYAKLGYMMMGADSRDRNIIFNSQNYQARFFEDIGSVVSEIIISSAKVKLSYLNKLLEAIPESVKLIVITQQSERDDLIDFNAENCVIQYEEKVNQTFTLIDGRIVWYGDISPLTYNYKEASAIRLINSSLALNLRVNALHESLALV